MSESGKSFFSLGKAQYMIKNLRAVNNRYFVKDPWASSDGANIPMLQRTRSQKRVSHGGTWLLPALRAWPQRAALDRGEEGCSCQQDHIDMGPHLGLHFLLGWHEGHYAARVFWGWHAVQCSSLWVLGLSFSLGEGANHSPGEVLILIPIFTSQEVHETGERMGQDWTRWYLIALFGTLWWAYADEKFLMCAGVHSWHSYTTNSL